MIRFRLRELVADLEFRRGGRVTLEEVAQATGIHRTTLTKIALKRGYNTTTNNLDALCRYFECPLDKLAAFVPQSDVLDGDVSVVAVRKKKVSVRKSRPAKKSQRAK